MRKEQRPEKKCSTHLHHFSSHDGYHTPIRHAPRAEYTSHIKVWFYTPNAKLSVDISMCFLQNRSLLSWTFLGENDSIACQLTKHGQSIIVKTMLPNITLSLLFCSHSVYTIRQASIATQFDQVTQQFINIYRIEYQNSFKIFMLNL